VSHQLSWSHYIELLKIDDDLERNFYQQQTIKENWSIRELKRHKISALFQRLALSKDKKGILALAKKGHIVECGTDIVKDPYVLEFLNIPEKYRYSEKELEQKIIDNLQEFLLELGKGFAFIGRQYRVTLNNKHYQIDLVFYHRILKCFVLIDLKIIDVEHRDIGQMNMYLGYFETEMNVSGDNPPVVIINLIKNSIESINNTTNGKIQIKAFLSLPSDIIIQVIDNGPGISADRIDKVFIPFFTTKEKGSGIGLSLSRQIMKLHGGIISVFSRLGEETVFSLRF
jgi:predicted nuclease of restriction endonuclease-like (RecB) superfamily